MSLAEHVADWAPGPVETVDAVDARALAAFAAAIDAPGPAGDTVPPLWHWFAFLDRPARAELGEDGHPVAGHFLPPIPHRRRMFAGGRLEVRVPLRVGERVLRRSALAAVTPKTGRSGELLFVTVRHEFRAVGDPVDDPAVVEEQDLVYRSQGPGPARSPRCSPTPPAPQASPAAELRPEPPPTPDGRAGESAWRIELHLDETLLFRFSALTYNAHRIHYDQGYARDVEGYPGLVVHGPLLALLLLELPRRFAPGARVTSFAYRLERPAHAAAPVVARREDDELVAGVPGRPRSVRGTVQLA